MQVSTRTGARPVPSPGVRQLSLHRETLCQLESEVSDAGNSADRGNTFTCPCPHKTYHCTFNHKCI